VCSDDNRFPIVNIYDGKYRKSFGGDIKKDKALVRSKMDLSSKFVLSTSTVWFST